MESFQDDKTLLPAHAHTKLLKFFATNSKTFWENSAHEDEDETGLEDRVFLLKLRNLILQQTLLHIFRKHFPPTKEEFLRDGMFTPVDKEDRFFQEDELNSICPISCDMYWYAPSPDEEADVPVRCPCDFGHIFGYYAIVEVCMTDKDVNLNFLLTVDSIFSKQRMVHVHHVDK